MSLDQLQSFHPSSETLLGLVVQKVDASMLREIAAADYGDDADEHLRALQAISRGTIPNPLEWQPKEVLELIRWSEPEDPRWSPGSVGERGHWMRLYACAVLLRAGAEPESEGYFLGEDSTIIQLVDSAIRLGSRTSNAALSFLCWRLKNLDSSDCDRPYYAIAVLLLLLVVKKCDAEVARFLIEAASNEECGASHLFAECQKGKQWQDVTRRVTAEYARGNDQVQEFARLLM